MRQREMVATDEELQVEAIRRRYGQRLLDDYDEDGGKDEKHNEAKEHRNQTT